MKVVRNCSICCHFAVSKDPYLFKNRGSTRRDKGGGRRKRRKVKRTRQHCERGGRVGMNKRMRRYASRNMKNGVKIAEDRQNRSVLIIEQRTKYQKPKYFPVSNAHCPRDPS